MLKESHEAWVHVIVTKEEDSEIKIYEGFAP